MSASRLLGGIVCRVYVINHKRAHAMDLEGRCRLRQEVVVRLCRQRGIAAGWHRCHPALVELVAHANSHRSRKDREVLVARMPVWRNLVAGGYLRSDDKGLRLRGIAGNYGEA